MTTHDIAAVRSQSALPEGLAADQEWKTQYDKSTIPLYTNVTFYTQVKDIAKPHDEFRKSNSDIESLTLSR